MVLRDTGSTTCVVVIFGQTRANYRIMCTLIDRLIIRYPTAVVAFTVLGLQTNNEKFSVWKHPCKI